MWKRIHSNRDPRDTLYSEIRNEFGVYFKATVSWFQQLTGKYPKFIFGSMVVIMAVSMALSFTIFRMREPSKAKVVKTSSTIHDGFTQIIEVTGSLRETLRLKALVDSLSTKKALTGEDSILLNRALDELARLHKKNN